MTRVRRRLVSYPSAVMALVAALAVAFGGAAVSPVLGRARLEASAHAAYPGPGARLELASSTEVPWGSTEIEEPIKQYRAELRPGAGRNVAVFQYEEGGQLRTITVASVSTRNGPQKAEFQIRNASGELIDAPEPLDRIGTTQVRNQHAEELIDLFLRDKGIPPTSVKRIHSELEPCAGVRGKACALRVIPRYTTGGASATVTHNFAFPPDDEAKRQQSRTRLEMTVSEYYRQLAWPSLFSITEQSRMSRATADLLFGRVNPGGIDLSSLELRYLSAGGSRKSEGVRFAFQARAGPTGEPTVSGIGAAQQASDAFFVWLVLPPSTFWVNLGPDEPDRIVDSRLGRTDVGRILLEADLQLKKTTAALIHPDTELGAMYWNAKRGDCRDSRSWITPGTAQVRQTSDELYILDAPLVVSTDADAALKGPDTTQSGSCSGQDKETKQHDLALFRSMILPKLEEAVNQAPEYADLRRVYLSRVAAEWIRDQSAKRTTAYSDIIDSGDIGRWVSRQPWDPKEVHARYVKSFTDGEFRVTHRTEEPTPRGKLIRTRTYIAGGVDFRSVSRRDVGDASFQKEWRHLPATVDGALHRVAADSDAQHLWLGGEVQIDQGDAARGGGDRQSAESRLAVIAVALTLLGFVFLTWVVVATHGSRVRFRV